MSAEVQTDLIRKICYDWYHSDDCSGVEAMAAIMNILGYDPDVEPPPVSHEMSLVAVDSVAGGES